jgi:hypothetical protein
VAKEPTRYDYARQKLFEAVGVLVEGRGMGKRLAHASTYLVELRADAPTELDCLLEPIIEALQPDKDDPAAAFRTKALALRSQGNKLARRIFELYLDVVGASGAPVC